MDEDILKKMEELIDKQLDFYIRPPNVENVQVKANMSFVEAEKVSEASPMEDWMKSFNVSPRKCQESLQSFLQSQSNSSQTSPQ